ncbi:hypothetical protein Hanom_Chr09g00762931 [Helianthus anomalus]
MLWVVQNGLCMWSQYHPFRLVRVSDDDDTNNMEEKKKLFLLSNIFFQINLTRWQFQCNGFVL